MNCKSSLLEGVLLLLQFQIIKGQPEACYIMTGNPVQTNPPGYKVDLARHSTVNLPWADQATKLVFQAYFQSNYRLRVKIFREDQNRYEVPLSINPASDVYNSKNSLYDITFQNDTCFSFAVTRRSSETVLFDTDTPNGNFIFANQYLTLSWQLYRYQSLVNGFGQRASAPLSNYKYTYDENSTFWAGPQGSIQATRVHPYYTLLENDGSTHSVAVINSNAQQFHLTGTGTVAGGPPIIRYVTIGGILDFLFFLGPTPENVVQQYTEAVGRPFLPPYWALGFHIGQEVFSNLTNLQNTINRVKQDRIPFDALHLSTETMNDFMDFTINEVDFKGLPEYINTLKEEGTRFITVLDPFIRKYPNLEYYKPLELGNKIGAWVKGPESQEVFGRVKNNLVLFPDYSKSATFQWWAALIQEYRNLLKYDGVILQNNQPYSDRNEPGCNNESSYNFPPFIPQLLFKNLYKETMCLDNVQEAGLHYNLHNMYGWYQSQSTFAGTQAETKSRSLIISQSTFIGSGKWVGHSLENDLFDSRLYNGARYISSVLEVVKYNQIGIPFVGDSSCSERILHYNCSQWMLFGAFHPFARNFVTCQKQYCPWLDIIDSNTVPVARIVLQARYTLLPYLYTLFFRSSTEGNTVARPIWHEFFSPNFWRPQAPVINKQFMWGSALMIAPYSSVSEMYIPDSRWYSFNDFSEVSYRDTFTTLNSSQAGIGLFMRGGSIIPIQAPAINTQLSRKNHMGLLVMLDDSDEASGSLFYDDGDSIDTIKNGEYFLAEYKVINGRTLTVNITKNGWPGMSRLILNNVTILGIKDKIVEDVKWKPDVTEKASWSWIEGFNNSGILQTTNLSLQMNSYFEMTWSLSSKSPPCLVKCEMVDFVGNYWIACGGETASMPCSNFVTNSSGVAYWKCDINGEFQTAQPDVSSCKSQWVELKEKELNQIKDINDAVDYMERFVEIMLKAQLPKSDYDYFGHEIATISSVIDQVILLTKGFNERSSSLENVVNDAVNINRLLIFKQTPWKTLSRANKLSISTNVLASTEFAIFSLTDNIHDGNFSKFFTLTNENDSEYSRVDKDIVIFADVFFKSGNSPYEFPQTNNQTCNFTFIKLPESWQDLVLNDKLEIAAMSISTDDISKIIPGQFDRLLSSQDLEERNETKENTKAMIGRLISFSTSSGSLEFPSELKGVEIHFKHDIWSWGASKYDIRRKLSKNEKAKGVQGSVRCVHWDTVDLVWSANGCKVLQSSNDETVCECSHLTSFALLMDVHNYVGKQPGLEELTFILCPLSMIGLAVTLIFTYKLQNPEVKTQILQNISICLLIGLPSILFILDKNFLNLNSAFCATFGILTHQIFLSVFAWMLIYAVILYKEVERLYQKENELLNTFSEIKVDYFYVIGYGIPTIIVVITAIVGFSSGDNPYGGDAYCWLQGSYIWGFAGPVGVVIILNAVIIGLLVKNYYMGKPIPDPKDTPDDFHAKIRALRRWIFSYFCFSFVLGITWVFGFFTMMDFPVGYIAAYFFTIINASQGIYIFIFHCVLDQHISFSKDEGQSLTDSWKIIVPIKERILLWINWNDTTKIRPISRTTETTELFDFEFQTRSKSSGVNEEARSADESDIEFSSNED